MSNCVVNVGDVVLVDVGLKYKSLTGKYTAVVLYESIYGQPLLTEVNRWSPHWASYETIAEVVGHIDLSRVVKWDD